MPGVRIQHPTARSCRFTVVERDRPYGNPYTCTPPEFGGCGSVHIFKTHHLNIDGEGAAVVEIVLYQKIKHLLVLNGFSESNVVDNPPPLGIGLLAQALGQGAWGNIPVVRGSGDTNG